MIKKDLTLEEFIQAQKDCRIELNDALTKFREKTGCIVTHVASHDTKGAQSFLHPEITF